jgi:aspartyl-tRNA(Asn)/glutamyl-tRNA(Gln) amidotransferase subunit C
MATSFDRKTVDHVAKLACLSLSEEQANALTEDVARIVAYVEELAAVDTTDVPPTAHVQLERLPLRDDEIRAGLTHEESLAQAPRVEEGGFAVPTFVGAATAEPSPGRRREEAEPGSSDGARREGAGR